MLLNILNLIMCCLLPRAFCLFEMCNHKVEMQPGAKLYVNSPYYPAEYPIGTSCRYAIKTAQGYKLKFACNLKINTPPLATKCQNEIFHFNSEGSEILTDSEYFCGTGKMERKSFLNQAILSYISTSDYKRIQTKTKAGGKEKQKKKINKTETESGKLTTTTSKTPTTSKLFKGPPLTITRIEPLAIKNHLLTTTVTHNVSSATSLPTSLNGKVNRQNVKDAIEKDTKVNNSFAYVVTLLSNKIDKEATQNSTEILKEKSTITTSTPAPTSSRPTSVLQLNNFLPVNMWRNDSMATYKISTKRDAKVVVGQDYTTSTTNTLHNVRAAGGGGSFSCLVEAVESPCVCGWGSTVKIAGASGVAGINEFPSMAGIMTIKNKKIFCGATIIHQRYLLSAAHCFLTTETNTPEYLTAVVGEHDLSTVLESFYTRQYDLSKIILHELFQVTSTQAQNDIALLKTRFSMEWNRSVGPVCLPFFSLKNNREAVPYAGQRVEAAGWGTTSFGGQQSSLLLKTTLDVTTRSTCQNLIGKLPLGVFCTYTPGRDTCQYDSGGALYVRAERLYAVGIVSYGFACATNQPSVNTRVASYLKWIRTKTPEAKYCE